MQISETLGRIRALPGVIGVHSLDARTLYKVMNEEMSRKSWLGMPLYNEAAKSCFNKDYNICIFSKEFVEPHPGGFITLVDDMGIEVGRFVSRDEREYYVKNTNNVWITNDFVLFPYRMCPGPIYVKMKGMNPTFLASEDGVASASIFYPCKDTDRMLKARYGLDPESEYASAILGLQFTSKERTLMSATGIAGVSF